MEGSFIRLALCHRPAKVDGDGVESRTHEGDIATAEVVFGLKTVKFRFEAEGNGCLLLEIYLCFGRIKETVTASVWLCGRAPVQGF